VIQYRHKSTTTTGENILEELGCRNLATQTQFKFMLLDGYRAFHISESKASISYRFH